MFTLLRSFRHGHMKLPGTFTWAGQKGSVFRRMCGRVGRSRLITIDSLFAMDISDHYWGAGPHNCAAANGYVCAPVAPFQNPSRDLFPPRRFLATPESAAFNGTARQPSPVMGVWLHPPVYRRHAPLSGAAKHPAGARPSKCSMCCGPPVHTSAVPESERRVRGRHQKDCTSLLRGLYRNHHTKVW
jgi:hypothetical protein